LNWAASLLAWPGLAMKTLRTMIIGTSPDSGTPEPILCRHRFRGNSVEITGSQYPTNLV
jgi:hypothetical protein